MEQLEKEESSQHSQRESNRHTEVFTKDKDTFELDNIFQEPVVENTMLNSYIKNYH